MISVAKVWNRNDPMPMATTQYASAVANVSAPLLRIAAHKREVTEGVDRFGPEARSQSLAVKIDVFKKRCVHGLTST
jgi:hypothetical protein